MEKSTEIHPTVRFSIRKSIDNSNTSTLDNRKVTLKVTSTGRNKNVLVKDSMGEFLTVAGGIQKRELHS